MWPKLVREKDCKTPCHVTIYGEGLTEEGAPMTGLDADLLCNYQDAASTQLTADKKVVALAGKALFPGDIAPDAAVISGGEITVFGETRQIARGIKARNPDGTVNYTELEVF